MKIPPSVRFAALLFLPALVPLLVPALCLGPDCVLLAMIQVADPASLEPAGLGGYCAWALGPLPAAVMIMALGLLCYRLVRTQPAPRTAWIAVWAVATLVAFLGAWYGIILVTSIGASETPPEVFLRITAAMTLLLIVLGQPGIVIWLRLVNRYARARQPESAPTEGQDDRHTRLPLDQAGENL